MIGYLSSALGGIGLFLLGMWLITEGLRVAAGASLEQLLARWTSSRGRGLAAGTLLTALLQSSSAVTIAAIGFVNAGLLSFSRAVWVIFGSNLGTTLTAWIIALVGFKFKIDVLALPIIGIGALLRVFAPVPRYQSLGMALAGFGILFLGIEVLAEGFGSLGQQVSLNGAQFGVVWMVMIGAVLTTLMQSSSAAMAVVLSAVAGGLIGLHDAAAVVIGANIGTTSSALLATLGATAQARRLALAHLLFNLLTATVALLLLVPMLALAGMLIEWGAQGDQATMILALFHTLFNLLGIVLMWPVEPAMSRWLGKRFAEPAQAKMVLQYLDHNVASLPDAAPVALCREFEPLLNEYPAEFTGLAEVDGRRLARSQLRLTKLDAIGDFFVDTSRYSISESASALLSRGWRLQHNLLFIEETLAEMERLIATLAQRPDAEQIKPRLQHWYDQLSEHLHAIIVGQAGSLDFVTLMPAYDQVKSALLQAALSAQISRQSLDQGLQLCSLSRRFTEQWLRARFSWQQMMQQLASDNTSSASAKAATGNAATDDAATDNTATDNATVASQAD